MICYSLIVSVISISPQNPETPLRDVTTTPNNQTPVRMIRPVYGGPAPRESSPATVRESVRLHTDLRKEVRI